MIHQFVTIEKLRTRLNPQMRPPLNYVVEVLSLATLKILDQTFKTFKGKARRTHRKPRHGTHFSELRGRFTVFRSTSPIRAAAALAAAGQSPPRHQALAASPPHPSHQQQQQAPRRPSLAVSSGHAPRSPPTAAGLDALTPMSDPGSTNGASALLQHGGVDFGVGHAAMYPFVTAGASFLIDVFDIITCQLFYNSDLIRFVDLLLALDHAPPPAADGQDGASKGPAADGTPTKSASGATTIKAGHWWELRSKGGGPQAQQFQHDDVPSGRLGRVPVPFQCVGDTYGRLFELLMAEYEAMPLALYRHDARADVYYAFTGPPPATILRASDCVFLLAPVESLRRILARFGH